LSGKLIPRRRNKTVVDVEADRLMRKIGVEKVVVPKPTKKHKDVVSKQRSREAVAPSVFEDMEEDYAPDFTELGLDVPRSDDW
jgi:hypothetical protein